MHVVLLPLLRVDDEIEEERARGKWNGERVRATAERAVVNRSMCIYEFLVN